MAKDKAYGASVFVLSVLIILYYTYWAVIIEILPLLPTTFPFNLIPLLPSQWAYILPIWIAVVGIFSIAAWVGWTMMTTPPPTPIEEFEESAEK
ncbi:MAG: hypothetical protein ACW976_02700 [Candidatus Ranarchaeia archaeon]